MMAPTQPWPGFKYVQVPGLANRKIARWLRTQRKNMRLVFAARGMADLALRMDQIRKSRQGMMAKNRMFQKVLDDYAKIANPGAASVAPAEAEDRQDTGDDVLAVPAADAGSGPAASGDREDADSSVPGLASEDSSEPVIEE